MSLCLPHLLHSFPPPATAADRRDRHLHLLPKSSASIATGSAADLPEPLLGTPKPPRRSVAGVDQDALVDPEDLADPDSAFVDFRGVRMHHKVADGDPKTANFTLPFILLHGFGASVYSWSRAMLPLAQLTTSKVLAFDRPAFGLTARVASDNAAPLNPYSMTFSVLATLFFADMLHAQKAVLIGHSAGCIVAVNAYFEAPERVAALVLVAPAIFAPLVPWKSGKEKGGGKVNGDGDGVYLGAKGNPFVWIWRGLRELFTYVANATFQMLTGMRDMIGSIYVKALSAVLRSTLAVMLVRMVMDKFGTAAVRNAWYDGNEVTHHVIQGYTKPLRVKGWEKALLEYTLAMITDSESKSKKPLTRRLTAISCPVLIITGDTDRLVPSSNAVRLSKAIPGSTLKVIKNCGHLPHEERVEEFLSVVEGFLQRVFGAQEGQFSTVAA